MTFQASTSWLKDIYPPWLRELAAKLFASAPWRQSSRTRHHLFSSTRLRLNSSPPNSRCNHAHRWPLEAAKMTTSDLTIDVVLCVVFQTPGVLMAASRRINADLKPNMTLERTHLVPSHPVDTKEDHTGLIVCVGWFFFVVAVFLYWLRWLGRKYWSMKKRSNDERLLFLSLILFAGCIIMLHCASLWGGLGLMNMTSTQTDDRYNLALSEKIIYTADITSTLSILLSRTSVILLLTDIFALNHMQWWIRQLRYPLVLWVCLSLLTLLFGCGPTQPWSGTNNNICMNRPAAYTATSILGLAVDTLLVVVPINTVMRTLVSEQSRHTIRGIFYARTGMLACVVAQLYFLWTAASNEQQEIVNPFADPWVVVSGQLVACYSILAACAPYMKHMFDGIGLGTVFASSQPDRGDGTEAMRPRPVYRYAAYSEYIGAEPVYDQFGNLREVNVDGDAIPLDVAADFEVARGEVVVMQELRRRSRVSNHNIEGNADGRWRIGSVRPDTGNSASTHSDMSIPRGECGRTAAQHAQLAVQRSRQRMINALDIPGSGIDGSGSSTCGGENIPITPTRLRQRSTSGFAFQSTTRIITTVTSEPGVFDFSEDPVEPGWDVDDGVEASILQLLRSADVHGMCSVPGCTAGSEWPSMTRLPRVGRLDIWKTVEVEVRYEDVCGSSFVSKRESLTVGDRMKNKRLSI